MAPDNARQLWTDTWKLLVRATHDKKSPFATPALATVGSAGRLRSRKIVLRKVDHTTQQLRGYTDLRSRKVSQLQENNWASWLFWDPKKRIQCSGGGPTSWLPREDALRIYQGLPKHSRKAYATLSAPGTAQEKALDGLPKDWEDRKLTETDYAADHFGVLVTQLEEVDILVLKREGHLRLKAVRNGDDWDLNWVIP